MFSILISKWGSEWTSGQRFSGKDSGNYMNLTHCSCRRFCRRKPLPGFSSRTKNLVREGNIHAIRVSNVILAALLIKITTTPANYVSSITRFHDHTPELPVLRSPSSDPQAEPAYSLFEIISSSSWLATLIFLTVCFWFPPWTLSFIR